VTKLRPNVWLLRPMPHGTNHMKDFLEHDFIAIGYPVGEELSKYDYGQIRNILQRFNWEEGVGNVNTFVHGMKKGDIVVVPDNNKKDVYFAKITSDYLYDKNVDKDEEGSGYPHQRKVEWFFNKTPILRSELPEALLGSLRYPGTLADLTKHYDVIQEILEYGTAIEKNREDLREEALAVLRELLRSENEEIRLRAVEIILK
jgi:restriction system protein